MGLRQSKARGVVPVEMKSRVKTITPAPLVATSPPYIPEYLSTLKPYVPGKPIEEAQREFNLKKVIKLASNENPLGPSPKAVQAAKNILKYGHLYPDAGAVNLKAALAKFYGFKTNEICVGNGSNEIIEFLIRTFCVPGNQILTSQYAFIAYKISAQAHGVHTIETPMQKDLKFDLSAMLEEIKRQHSLGKPVRIVFIANPNNPTGTLLSRSKLNWFLKEVQMLRSSAGLTQGYPLVVLDSAYDEYLPAPKTSAERIEYPDWKETVRDFENVVVLKTFSKAYGLAGLRAGFAIAAPEIISRIERVRMPFNLNSVAMVAAEAALTDQTFVKKAVQLNRQGLKQWTDWLDSHEIPFWPSSGNFILLDTQMRFQKSGVETFEALLRLGVIVRPVANYGLINSIRVSVGTATENAFAMKCFEKAMGLKLKKRIKRKTS